MKFSIVIPCYNEALNLEGLIGQIEPLIKEYDVEFILVENGSTDNSREVFEALDSIDGIHIKAVYVDHNQGYGYGILCGLKDAEGAYVGWLHADMQVSLKYLEHILDYIQKNGYPHDIFIKGKRENRSLFDKIFTMGQSLFDTLLFCAPLYDIGAIPVVFDSKLLSYFSAPAYDFSFELYAYLKALQNDYRIKRIRVKMKERKKGASSWNKGLRSKLRQSMIIIKDSIEIKRNEVKG